MTLLLQGQLYCLGSSIQILEDACRAHAAADTHRHETIFTPATLHLVDQLDSKFRACAAERVTERNRAAVDVDLLAVEFEVADHGEGLRGESLVEFNQVEVIDGHPLTLE